MSRDIRSYFLSSKQSAPKQSDSEEKSRKKVNNEKDKSSIIKKHSKKRVILSSDEEDDTCQTNNKKAKVSSNVTIAEKPLEVPVDPKEVFGKKPVKRVNAPTISKKINNQVKKSNVPNSKIDFMNDDDFDATLNQLDTSQIEDEYLATVTKDTKDDAEKNKSETLHKTDDDLKKNEKSTTKSRDKNKTVEKPSTSKNKHSEKGDSEIKHEKLKEDKDKNESIIKEKKKKQISHEKLEIEKTIKSTKVHDKCKDESFNEIIEDKIEKKKQHAILYQNYLNRGGARNPGSKEIPQGAENCFVNLSFLITGVLESLEREQAEGIIKQYGGKVVHSVSKKLSYLVVGEEAGPSKLAKAESLGIKQITEDDFLELLRSRPAGKESRQSTTSDANNKRKRRNSSSNDERKSPENVKKNKGNSSSNGNNQSPQKLEKDKDLSSMHDNISLKDNKPTKCSPLKNEIRKEIPNTQHSETEEKLSSTMQNKINESAIPKIESITNKPSINNVSNAVNNGVDHVTALVEKYRPKEMKQLIGQTGDKSNAKKLQYWITNWYKNHGKDSKGSKPKFSSKDDTGTIYKAALLSGPPGIGKTTTAYVVCAQLGFEILEFNASDTRSKKLLQEEIAGILSNKTMKSFLTNTPDTKKTPPKHVLLMDEVDGMAGNEDRGGMQELITFIKSTEIPIICICNDRNSQKIKALSNYTFDLRFQKPRLEQIRAAIMSLCFKERIEITPDKLTQIIQSTNQDIRQVINHVAMLSAKAQSTTPEIKEKMMYKNLRLGPWDVIRKVFSAEEHKNMNIHEKSDLFFHDYNIAPLFVEENYPIVTPAGPKDQVYEKLAKCTESLAIGDVVERHIRSNQAWRLLPVQAMFSSVIPGTIMSGYINSQINFPSWLGKNSKSSKCNRLLQDITVHARITTGASKESINLDYIKMLVNSIISPLAVEGIEGVDKAVEIMNQYHLSREDLDSLIELTKWPHTRDLMQAVDTKTKTAFTKAYNKSASFSSAGTMKKKSTAGVQDDDFIGDDDEQLLDDNEDDEKIENDKLIKAKTSKSKPTSSESKSKTKSESKPKTKNTSRSKKK